MFEYVVWDNLDGCVHRGPWSEEECLLWMDECREAFNFREGVDVAWSVRRREVTEWESY